MQIQLKQVEIVEALKAHITKQGFSLAGKTVDISFTAGRKDAGLSADISIEDAELPNLTGDDAGEEVVAKPVLAMVKTPVAAVATPETEKAHAEPVAEAAAAAEPAAEKVTTTSLFG